MSVTTKEIAKRLGISQPSVSRILNAKNGANHSPETRRRVLEMAEAMNYRPNAIARALQQGRTETIAVACTFSGSLITGNLYFAELLDGILSESANHEYSVLMRYVAKPEKLKNAIFGDGQADGCIWVAPLRDDPLLRDLALATAPVVVVASRTEHATACVLADNYQAIDMVLRHLRELGHRRVLFVSGPETDNMFEISERTAAFKHVCERYGMAGSEAQFWDVSEIFSQTGGARPTAALGWNDNVAITVMQELSGIGLRVPEDVSVVGFDSTHFCDTVTPALTSVYQPTRAIGERAAHLLIEGIEGTQTIPDDAAGRRVEVFPCRLDIRGTTGPARP